MELLYYVKGQFDWNQYQEEYFSNIQYGQVAN